MMMMPFPWVVAVAAFSRFGRLFESAVAKGVKFRVVYFSRFGLFLPRRER